ncbi:MAG: ATP-binding protein [Zavarzinella sp.]|nr:ATP-binding protein [Zavarzinella sp.]
MNATTANGSGSERAIPASPLAGADDYRRRLEEDVTAAGGPAAADPEVAGAVGRTMFDQPGSADLGVTVLLHRDRLQTAPSQALVRIKSRPDGRSYLGVVTAGPFAEPDGLRADSSLMVALGTHDSGFLPEYHGRVQVTILGQETKDGALVPPRLRPLPNSPVFVLDDAEAAKLLKCGGDIRLGSAVGHEAVRVGVPSGAKAVLPRHTAVLGTTGGGKSTTVAGLVKQAADAGWAVVLLDVDGEYTRLNEPTADPQMVKALAESGMEPGGIPGDRFGLYHLAGRETTNPTCAGRREFSLQFARLSPYTVMDLLDLNEAQRDRFLFAYDLAKGVLRAAGIFPENGKSPDELARQERLIVSLDEFERGYPRLTLSLFLDVVGACKARVNKAGFEPYSAELKEGPGREYLDSRLHEKDSLPGVASSWGKLQSVLWRLHRLQVFHGYKVRARPIVYADLLGPGRVSVIDLSDAGMTELSNLAVSDVLRGIQEEQERWYRQHERGEGPAPGKVLIVVEEAHEFLSAERVDKCPALFAQVARLAKRGRKRWLALAFVTQLPQHLPKQVLGLVNSFVLHKLTDPAVVSDLKKTVAGIDDGLWARLPGLAPGQAIASFPHFTRPLLVSVDPAPGQLRMTE